MGKKATPSTGVDAQPPKVVSYQLLNAQDASDILTMLNTVSVKVSDVPRVSEIMHKLRCLSETV